MSEANTTVLVADDDSTIRRNLVRLLQSEGYQTIEAADGDEALAGVRAKNPDAVLLDLKMPGRDGLKVLAELQPLLADLPVIVVTALGGSAAAIEAMRRGAYDYLSKPFDLDEVLLTLKRALRQRALAIEVKALRARTKQDASRHPGRMRRRRAGADRPECRDARGLQIDRAGGRDGRPRSDRRRERNRQGAGRRCAPSPFIARGRPLDPCQLWGVARGPGRKRVVRS